MIYQYILDGLLGVILVISLITDLKSRKILNVVTFPGILLGLTLNPLFHVLNDGATLSQGLKKAFIGFGVAVVFYGIIYILGGIEAGDLKLMAAIGAITGPIFVMFAFVYISIAGGVLILFYLIWKGQLGGAFASSLNMFLGLFSKKHRENSKKLPKLYVPYGPAIFLGTVWFYIARHLGTEII